MGLSMLVISFGLGLFLLTLIFDGFLSGQRNPNQQPVTRTTEGGNVEVVLESNRQGHYVATGRINQTGATLLLDTGATDVVVSEQLADKAGLERGAAMRATTANGLVTVYATVIDELILGAIELREVRASINPAMGGDTVLLGMSALRRVEFTQRGDNLILRPIP